MSDQNSKGKPINTSVPSMSIRFNATSEELEELFDCEEEPNESLGEAEKEKLGELETSPRRSILPFGKRSTSVDVSAITQDASPPPSDPWRFLHDIKGKITKSVEGKLTEYKAKNQEGDGSPKLPKPPGKENSSLSDSEEVSESSISRTCGIVSTTEGVEMSSDDDDVAGDEDETRMSSSENRTTNASETGTAERRRCRLVEGKSTVVGEGAVSPEFLEGVRKVTSDGDDARDADGNGDGDEVESGVDALADLNVANFALGADDVLTVERVSGEQVRRGFGGGGECETVFGPRGFVDFRPERRDEPTWVEVFKGYQSVVACFISMIVYFYVPLSSWLSGFILGVVLSFAVAFLYFQLNKDYSVRTRHNFPVQILKFPAIREHQPLKKREGWMNEFPEEYDPRTYHIMQTQPVFLRLQGNFLRVSNTRHKIPKRATWNEPEHKITFSSHRVYNLLNAKVGLLPDGLAKIRHWSKKYPICITLNKDQLNIEKKENSDDDVEKKKVVEETEEFTDVEESDEEVKIDLDYEGDFDSETNKPNPDQKIPKSSDQTRIYLFGRTDREKEDWYRRLVAATHRNAEESNISTLEAEYVTYMRTHKEKLESSVESSPDRTRIAWVNSLMTRVMFDCIREESVVQRLKERIQRKLASIRLPYFIQELNCEELTPGTTSPIITAIGDVATDDRGLWLDVDIDYRGLIAVILQTKVNLLKLKQPQNVAEERSSEGKSAIFHSDIDDSAESSTDEDSSDGKPTPVSVSETRSPASNRGKKIMKMVDRIAESKFFQVATENKFIKKAMQDISNTDLRLKVEFKKCVGTMVLNIPPPPSDRLWIGFRQPPDLLISACPTVGERNINFLRVTSWIEKIIYKEFQKVFVIPNMEDLPISVMSPKLPE